MFPFREQTRVTYRSFELDPHQSKQSEQNVYENLASKYGMSREQAINACEDIRKQAEKEGLDFQFERMIPTNTFDAHRLTLLASKYDKRAPMTERLFRAYFTEGKRLSDFDTLVSLAEDVGLDRREVVAMLDGDAYRDEVRAEQREAGKLGVRAVPFYVINRKYAISGAHERDFFLETLQKAWREKEESV